jgi:hypothetical protein
LNGSRAVLYLHISAADLATGDSGSESGAGSGPGSGGTGGGRVEKLGPATLVLLRDWLQRTSGVTIRPVLDMNATGAVDTHDPPAAMREQVILRDRHCVFPGCTVDARRCDQDHMEPYVPLDDGGPPGQTSAANLACLCRRHHRMKTFTGWTYRRCDDGSYLWTSTDGTTYRSDP